MRAHTISFVTPLFESLAIRYVGTGSYIVHNDQRYLLTCEHVSREGPLDHRFYGLENDFPCQEPFVAEPLPVDAAASPVPDDVWNFRPHEASCVLCTENLIPASSRRSWTPSFPSTAESSDRHAGDNSRIRQHPRMPPQHGPAPDSDRNWSWDGRNCRGVGV